MLHIYIDMV